MVFVTVGSQKFQFIRLLEAVDELIGEGVIKDNVLAQTGHSPYVAKNFESRAFMDRDDFLSAVQKSDVVIAHGGTGAIIASLKAGKKVVAVPRLEEFGEHVDDHQTQIVELFTERGFICSCIDIEHLGAVYLECLQNTFPKYVPNNEIFCEDLDAYLQTIIARNSWTLL